MKVLLLGSGGREHAFAWKIAQSSVLEELYIAPGNAGTRAHGTNVDINTSDFESVKAFVLEKKINMVVVGPEDLLVLGIHDFFLADDQLKNIPVIGPDKEGAQLEGSKDFSKKFMARHNIPTAKYATFTKDTLSEGYAFLESLKPPFVLKADGLCAGKGVLILDNLPEAKAELKNMLADAKFGEASSRVVIEQFLKGIELSVFVITDGDSFKILPEAKDYKRIGEGDLGLNTGGMGAISPVPFADETFKEKIKNQIIIPTVKGLKSEGIVYKGFIFFVLISVKGTLSERDVLFDDRSACTVMMVSGGYPEAFEKGKQIYGLNAVTDSIVFHAGTSADGPAVMSNGGRVLSITSYGKDLNVALRRSYDTAEKIEFENAYYRTDIGFDVL